MKPARLAREAAGVSTAEACRAARISLSTLRKLECGYPASARVAVALARFYGCTDAPFRRHRAAGPAQSTKTPAGTGSRSAGGER